MRAGTRRSLVLVGILAALLFAARTFDGSRRDDPILTDVRENFGLCRVGGGRNCVVDGDTFRLRGERIRIAGIDAPETHDFQCAREQQQGERSARRLQQLLNSGPLELRRSGRDRDRNGRLLRKVRVNGRDVGEQLVQEKLA